MKAGPAIIRFFWPMIVVLREFGGSARPAEVIDRAVEILDIDDDELAVRTKSGDLRVNNQCRWARLYLVRSGLIDGSTRGLWSLTKQGWDLPLDEQSEQTALALFRRVQSELHEERNASREPKSDDATEEDFDATEEDDAEGQLVNALRSTVRGLTPAGFENLCKQLLAQLGLVRLRTVGQAGDLGIDVKGHIRVNSIISFRVGVQCKRYSDDNKVTPRQIRELQGALGPFDRGIFMTTSVFTRQAEEQASSPGYKPIDTIDGERLIELLLEHELGIRQITIVDEEFFAPFS